MARYHDYLIPPGDFDAMYAAEESEGFDSWRQFDARPLQARILPMLVEQEHFSSLVDLGCGKGTVTHLFAKPGRRVVGYDVSETALLKAATMFNGVQWRRGDALDAVRRGEPFDVALFSQSLYLQAGWRNVLAEAGSIAGRVVVNEYLPQPTKWYIPSVVDLEEAFRENYEVTTKIVFNDDRIYLDGKTK